MALQIKFQSLSGFQVRCNPGSPASQDLPVGAVSIPIGFSSSLQRSALNAYSLFIRRFQSLSGFQVRCNDRRPDHGFPTQNVSIPIGFSSSLQLLDPRHDGIISVPVSIPIGFSSSLQPSWLRIARI